METAHRSRKLTYADYLRFPDDLQRHEIIDGDHYVTPSPVTKHQRISRELQYFFMRYLEEHPVGEVFDAPFDVLLSDSDVVVPDLVFVSRARAHFVTSKNLQGPPDLIVEILSPGTARRDRQLKRDLYERVGVREYWLVDPDAEAVTVYRSSGSRFEAPEGFSKGAASVLTTALLPGLEIPFDRVFG